MGVSISNVLEQRQIWIFYFSFPNFRMPPGGDRMWKGRFSVSFLDFLLSQWRTLALRDLLLPTLWELPICSDHDPSPSSDLQGNHKKHLSFFLQREWWCLLQAHHLGIDVANSIWRLNAKWWLYCSQWEQFFPRSNGCYWLLIWKN